VVDGVSGVPARPVLVVDAVQLRRLIGAVRRLGLGEERFERFDAVG
jgi:hypothetical protein